MNDWRWYRRQHRRWAWFYIVLASAWILWAAFVRPAHSAELVWVDGCDKCSLDSGVEAYRLAASFPGRWLRFGLSGDIYWTARQRIVLSLKDGRQVPSEAILGVGPMESHGRPIRLGLASRWLHQDELEQGHRGRGGLILACFPDSMMTSRIVGVHLERGAP